ncbi:MAG: serine hydrolase domain-containing protein [Bacteroidota bacterium]
MKSSIFFLATMLLLLCSSCIKEHALQTSSDYDCISTITNTHPKSEEFDAFISAKIAEGIPGMMMLIESPDGIWAGAAGMADIPNQIPMQPCNLSRIGSVTKTFTATLILRLQTEGLLNITDKISDYLPAEIIAQIANGTEATIENLLNHTSGIPDYTEVISYSVDFLNSPTWLRTDEGDLQYIYGEPAEFAPDAQRKYSNTNFILLGLLAEAVAGKSGRELYQEYIFQPLGLNNTYFNQLTPNFHPKGLVRGYSNEENKEVIIDRTDFTFGHTSMTGGIISNLEDLRTYIQAIFINQSFFSEEVTQQLTTVKPVSGEDHTVSNKAYSLRSNGVGLGWFNLTTPYGTAYGHGGALRGYKSFIAYFPDTQTTICYLINGHDGFIDDLDDKMRGNELIPLIYE